MAGPRSVLDRGGLCIIRHRARRRLRTAAAVSAAIRIVVPVTGRAQNGNVTIRSPEMAITTVSGKASKPVAPRHVRHEMSVNVAAFVLMVLFSLLSREHCARFARCADTQFLNSAPERAESG